MTREADPPGAAPELGDTAADVDLLDTIQRDDIALLAVRIGRD